MTRRRVAGSTRAARERAGRGLAAKRPGWTVALGILLGVACASPEWHRPGSTAADLAADKAACTAESGNDSGVSNLYTSRFVRRCLKQRGWVEGEAPDARAAAASAGGDAPPDAGGPDLAGPDAGGPDASAAATGLTFDQCFERCRSLTDRTKEECFDTCLEHPAGDGR